jgi:hypothetical protein
MAAILIRFQQTFAAWVETLRFGFPWGGILASEVAVRPPRFSSAAIRSSKQWVRSTPKEPDGLSSGPTPEACVSGLLRGEAVELLSWLSSQEGRQGRIAYVEGEGYCIRFTRHSGAV